MEKFNIFGFTGDKKYTIEDLFDVTSDESDIFFAETKETFEHDEEDLKFNYKYVIDAEYCDGKVFYSLSLVPTPESLSEEKLNGIHSCSGIDVNECNIWYVVSYGCSIHFASHSVDGEDIDHNIIEDIANAVRFIDRLKGFYLDKYQNRIGSTGWDYLNDFINDIDYIQVTMERWKKEKGE